MESQVRVIGGLHHELMKVCAVSRNNQGCLVSMAGRLREIIRPYGAGVSRSE